MHSSRLWRLAAALPLILANTLVCRAGAKQPSTTWGIGPFVKMDAANPVLSPGDAQFFCPATSKWVRWEEDNVFNPAAVVRGDRVYVLYRAEDGTGNGIGKHTSRIGLASSLDGKRFKKSPRPVLFPDNDSQKGYDWPGGCEDPRVVETEDGRYVLLYTAWNRQNATLSVATSPDLTHWTKQGPAFGRTQSGRFVSAWSKSASIVCRLVGDHLIAVKIAGKYWMYWGEGQIHAATSGNLIDWDPVTNVSGGFVTVMDRRAGKWDSDLVECGPPALMTPAGIVLLFNGKNSAQNGDPGLRAGTYSAGQALFAADAPTRLLDRRDGYFLTAEKPYETSGQYHGGTVFIEGLVHFRGRWFLYYGTADSHVAVACTAVAPALSPHFAHAVSSNHR